MAQILDILYPNVCGVCNKISNESLCKDCKNQIDKYKNIEVCYKFKNLKAKLNSDIYFDKQIYFYLYKDLIRHKVIEYKFGEKSYLYKMFAKMIMNEDLEQFCKGYNYMIPVPISKKRIKERGYNQTFLIAKELEKKIEIEVENKILYKIKDIKPQSSMSSKKDRIENVKGVYKVSDYSKVDGKKILLFDDIFTTGSTINECAKVLKKAGAEKIGVITIAKD